MLSDSEKSDALYLFHLRTIFECGLKEKLQEIQDKDDFKISIHQNPTSQDMENIAKLLIKIVQYVYENSILEDEKYIKYCYMHGYCACFLGVVSALFDFKTYPNIEPVGFAWQNEDARKNNIRGGHYMIKIADSYYDINGKHDKNEIRPYFNKNFGVTDEVIEKIPPVMRHDAFADSIAKQVSFIKENNVDPLS